MRSQLHKIKLTLIALLLLLCATTTALANNPEEKSTIKVDRNENWWGGFTALGHLMPFMEPIDELDLGRTNLNNQSAMFFVSNQGRYIYSGKPASWSFDGREFTFHSTEKIKVKKVGRNLRSAFVVAINDEMHHHPPVIEPDTRLFSAPQYNTTTELLHGQSQVSILEYANSIIKNNFEPGVLIIDDSWQKDYGTLDFRSDRFWDPGAMIDSLHNMGFSVMLWVSPYVSPDSRQFRTLRDLGYLVVDSDSNPTIARWKQGYSAMVDMENLEAMAWFENQLADLQKRYKIDGFKFDGADLNNYAGGDVATRQLAGWQTVASGFALNEMRAAWGGTPGDGGRGVVQKLNLREFSWESLGRIIPQTVAAGLLGYPFSSADILSDGLQNALIPGLNYTVDQELLVRSAQIAAFMPIMQFNISPWRVLEQTHLEHVRTATELHKKLAPYINVLVQSASQTGEPIIRSMEYNYPRQGFSDCVDQFMLGTKYIVTPIVSKDHRRLVRLPRGVWTDDQGETFRGPLVMEIEAGVDRLPYYTRK